MQIKCSKCGTAFQVGQPALELLNGKTGAVILVSVQTVDCPGLECGEQYRSVVTGAKVDTGYAVVPPEQRKSGLVIPHGNMLTRIAAGRGNGSPR